MSKLKKRARTTEAEPSGSDAFSADRKRHQIQEQPVVSDKILKEALLQLQREEDNQNPNKNHSIEEDDDEDDSDDSEGFSETQRRYGEYDDNEENTKWLDDVLYELAWADTMVEKIKEKGAKLMPKLDDSIIEHYRGVGKLLSKYTSGKIPKAFKYIPSLQVWEEVLYLTEPEKWSPDAMYQVTRIFASNMDVKKVERFYKFVLLPRVREDIRKNQRLPFALYQSLKKALYKPAAFYKGIIFPLCESGTCTLREAVIVGGIMEKVSIPPLHSSAALLKLAEMEYRGTTSYFIKILIEKKYALPYRVLDALVAHCMKLYDDSRVMPVIWHQSLLALAQRNELTEEDKAALITLVERQRHNLVTPEILKELNNSRNRGEKR